MRPAKVLSALPHSREAVDNLRGKVVQMGEAALPRVASAAQNTGDAVSRFALSSSRQVAQTLRHHQPSRSTRLATLLPPLMRRGLRVAARHPGIIAVAGVGIAVVGVAAWRRQHARTEAESAPHADATDDIHENEQSEDQSDMREL